MIKFFGTSNLSAITEKVEVKDGNGNRRTAHPRITSKKEGIEFPRKGS